MPRFPLAGAAALIAVLAVPAAAQTAPDEDVQCAYALSLTGDETFRDVIMTHFLTRAYVRGVSVDAEQADIALASVLANREAILEQCALRLNAFSESFAASSQTMAESVSALNEGK